MPFAFARRGLAPSAVRLPSRGGDSPQPAAQLLREAGGPADGVHCMLTRVLVALACLAAGTAARAAEGVSLGIEATLGAQRLGMTRAPGLDQPLLAMGDYGGTALLTFGSFALGAAAEGNFRGGALDRYDASALAGLVADLLPVLRLELLGELGAANLRTLSDARAAASGAAGWSRFYGFRPGLSAKVPVLPLRVGVWGLARWGLPGTGPGPAYGMLGRVGLEF